MLKLFQFSTDRCHQGQAQEAFQLFKTPGRVKGKILLSIEVKYQWHGLVRDGFKVLGMQASATHAGIPEIEKLAGHGIGDRCRLDRIVKPDGVGLGHAILPKEIEI